MSTVPRIGRPWNQCRRRNTGWSRRSAITRRDEVVQGLVDRVPVEPRDLVVLAVGVVVAALACGRSRRRRAASARPARATGSRGSCAVAGAGTSDDRPRRRSGLRRRSSTSGCGSRRRCCPRRSPRCASRRTTTRSARVKPSCAVTKLMLATGRRVSAWYRSELPVRRDASSGSVAGSPRQKSRTVSRYLPFHSDQTGGKLPTW